MVRVMQIRLLYENVYSKLQQKAQKICPYPEWVQNMVISAFGVCHVWLANDI